MTPYVCRDPCGLYLCHRGDVVAVGPTPEEALALAEAMAS